MDRIWVHKETINDDYDDDTDAVDAQQELANGSLATYKI